jgi:hypothetical protein
MNPKCAIILKWAKNREIIYPTTKFDSKLVIAFSKLSSLTSKQEKVLDNIMTSYGIPKLGWCL